MENKYINISEKTYKCRHCEKSFITNIECTNHIKYFHDIGNNECINCLEFKFSKKDIEYENKIYNVCKSCYNTIIEKK